MPIRVFLAAVLSVSCLVMTVVTAHPHGGGVDAYGCHHDRKQGGYHCHRGELAGQAFASKQDMLRALERPPAPAAPQQQATTVLTPQPSAPSHSSSKGYSFTFSVLSSLHFCNWAKAYALELTGNEDFFSLTTNFLAQKGKFQQAKAVIADYLTDEDREVNSVAKGMVGGIDLHIGAIDKRIEIMKNLGRGELQDMPNLEIRMAELSNAQRTAWETIAMSSGSVITILVEFPETPQTKGPIPFRITERERLDLLRQLDKYFADDLKKYQEHREARARGQEADPNTQNWIVFAVSHIRDQLSVRTYEEALAKEKVKAR